MELVSFELSLEEREGIQADVTVYQGMNFGNCRHVRQLHLEQPGAAGPRVAGTAGFALGAHLWP